MILVGEIAALSFSVTKPDALDPALIMKRSSGRYSFRAVCLRIFWIRSRFTHVSIPDNINISLSEDRQIKQGSNF